MVIEPLNQEELKIIFDEPAKRVFNFYLNKAMTLQPERGIGQSKLPIHIPKEHIEQWFVQAIGAKSVGAGSYPIDIITDKFGADVKMLSCKVDSEGKLSNSASGETSLAQKFRDTGSSLDQMFENKEYNKIVNGWIEILKSKYEPIFDVYPGIKLYYLFFLRADMKFYIAGFKVNVKEFENIEPSKTKKHSRTSVFIDNFIDSRYGNVKIYKSKKRMELRLYPKALEEDDYLILFDKSQESKSYDLRQLAKEGKLGSLLEEMILNIRED